MKLEEVEPPEKKHHYNWRGGRSMTPAGYILVKLPTHPRADINGYVFEHIVVLEHKLGRFLSGNEDTHHINGDKSDNRPENLICLTKSQHHHLHTNGIPCSEETKHKLSEIKRCCFKVKGKQHPHYKFTQKQVDDIRQSKATMTQKELAVKYSVSREVINRIQNNLKWGMERWKLII
jgi:hypothetical protein